MIEDHRSLLLVLVAVAWILCGIISAGRMNAFWRGRYPMLIRYDGRRDLIRELALGLAFGPIVLLVAVSFVVCFTGGRDGYGWTLSGSRQITHDDDRRRSRAR